MEHLNKTEKDGARDKVIDDEQLIQHYRELWYKDEEEVSSQTERE